LSDTYKIAKIEIVLPVSILNLSLSLACASALAYQILCKLNWMIADGVM